ncbi:hypothetical protein [Pandoraea sp. NPDC090278]|uniref:hypothetical protein n=1 Tax=Pandoraea sp. NPDC090278 TaxID=3364391 RepID=UPI00383B2CE7
MTIAKRFLFDQIYDVAQASGGVAMPAGFLYAPGIYQFNGVSYDMTKSGVYRFLDPASGSNAWRAVTWNDPMEMCSVFAELSCHGGEDNAQPITALNQIARNRRARITCGVVVPWAQSWLASAGFQSRIVRFLTMTTPNGFDDGHVCVEVKWNGSWVLADLDLGRYYTTAGSALSAKDFVGLVPSFGFTIVPLAHGTSKLDTSPLSSATFNYASYNEITFATPTMAQQWVQRICQAVGIDASDGNTYWLLPAGSQSRASWVTGLQSNYKVDTDPAVWAARFYP